jgi:hypothetical protein
MKGDKMGGGGYVVVMGEMKHGYILIDEPEGKI